MPEQKHISPVATLNGTYALPKINVETLKKESLYSSNGFQKPDDGP